MFSNAREPRDAAPTASPYQAVLGDAYDELDPPLRAYFGPLPDGIHGAGVGCFDHAGLRRSLLRPLFGVLAPRGIAFPERADGVPFTVRNTPGEAGARSATRVFCFPGATRVMVDEMRVVDGRLVDRIGSRGDVEVELALSVSEGGLRMASRRLAVRVLGVRIPLPPLVRIVVQDRMLAGGAQHVDVRIRAPLLGEIYGYAGSFTYELRAGPDPGERGTA